MEIISDLNAVTLLRMQAQAKPEKQPEPSPRDTGIPDIFYHDPDIWSPTVIEFSVPAETYIRKWSTDIVQFIRESQGQWRGYLPPIQNNGAYMRIALMESQYNELLQRLDGYYQELIEQIGHS